MVLGYIIRNLLVKDDIFTDWHGFTLITNGWGGIALWFVTTLIFVQVVYYLIYSFSCILLPSIKEYIIGFWVIVCTALSYRASQAGLVLPYKFENVGLALLFFASGSLCSSIITKLKGKVWVMVFLFVLTAVMSQCFPRFDICSNNFASGLPSVLLAFAGAIGVISLSKLLESYNGLGTLKKILTWAGQNTFIIMGLSQIIMLILISIIKGSINSPIINFTVRQVIMWASLVLLSKLFNQVCPTLIGQRK